MSDPWATLRQRRDEYPFMVGESGVVIQLRDLRNIMADADALLAAHHKAIARLREERKFWNVFVMEQGDQAHTEMWNAMAEAINELLAVPEYLREGRAA